MKTIFTTVFFLATLSAGALEIEKRFTTPVVSHRPNIDETQKESVSALLKYMNEELAFIEGGSADLPHVSEVQRFGGNATQASHFIGLLKSAGLWEIQVRFRDFGEQDSAFIMIDHSSPGLKTIEVNSGREDFLLKHFAKHLPQSRSVVEGDPTHREAEQDAGGKGE